MNDETTYYITTQLITNSNTLDTNICVMSYLVSYCSYKESEILKDIKTTSTCITQIKSQMMSDYIFCSL